MASRKADRSVEEPNDKDLTGTQALHGRALISDLLNRMEKKLAENPASPSIGDFIRLLQLEREMAEEEPAREIRVTWIDPRKESGTGR